MNLTALSRATAEKLRAAAPDRAVEWTIAEGMEVSADAGLIAIAIENLLDNAWKYTARQGVARIAVGLTQADGEDTITVTDNGVGFDMVDATKLFAPFSRLQSAADFDGTGVGLATVQRIVHRHGGRIWVKAEPGKGATFSFTLPQMPAGGQQSSDPHSSS